jgi:2-dehydro-3-deoxygluconokinase
MKKKILTFGEVMLRINPSVPGERLAQASGFTIEPGGSESNVAICLSLLGNDCEFITKLPANALSEKVIRALNSYSVGTSFIAHGGSRVGTYWTEVGTGPRASQVLYDRAGSSFSEIAYADFNWRPILVNAGWFHTSGISAAVSERARKTLTEVLEHLGSDISISIDLNYRSTLWHWARGKKLSIPALMWKLCSRAHLIVGNETDFQDALGIEFDNAAPQEYYEQAATYCFKRLPQLNFLAISLRDSVSASENNWSGLLFVREKKKIVRYKGPDIRITDIVDRIGTGDSFAAGIIHGLINGKNNYQKTVDFTVALSALNHTVRGDASQCTVDDVEHLLKNQSGRIIR